MMFYKTTDFADSPSKIPRDWEVIKMGDAASVKGRIGWRGLKASEYTPKGPCLIANKHVINTKIMWEKCDHLTEFRYEESPEIQLKTNDVIMSKDGTIGQPAFIDILPDKATLNSTMMLLRITDSRLVPKFLFYFLQGPQFERFLAQKISGTSIPHLFQRDMRELDIILPPHNEQMAIVGVLGVVDSAIELADKVIAKTERLKKGLMQQLLTRGIGHQQFKYSKELGSEVPKDWDVIKYDKANERIFVGIATSSTKHFASEGIPLIRNQNIKEKGIDLNDLTYITKNFAEANKSKTLKENDIVTVRTGFPGLSSKVTKEMEGWQTFTTLISRPKLGEFDPDYLVYVLNSPVCRNQIARLQSGLAQQNLNVGAIVNLYVPKPPKTEQIQIAERIKIFYEKQRIEEAYLEKLKLIKQGLMNELLTGKVRVKAD